MQRKWVMMSQLEEFTRRVGTDLAETQLWIGAMLAVIGLCAWVGLGITTALAHRSNRGAVIADGSPAEVPRAVRPARVAAQRWALCARKLTMVAVTVALMGAVTYIAVDTDLFKSSTCLCSIGSYPGEYGR